MLRISKFKVFKGKNLNYTYSFAKHVVIGKTVQQFSNFNKVDEIRIAYEIDIDTECTIPYDVHSHLGTKPFK